MKKRFVVCKICKNREEMTAVLGQVCCGRYMVPLREKKDRRSKKEV